LLPTIRSLRTNPKSRDTTERRRRESGAVGVGRQCVLQVASLRLRTRPCLLHSSLLHDPFSNLAVCAKFRPLVVVQKQFRILVYNTSHPMVWRRNVTQKAVHQCECEVCRQPGEHADKQLHHQMNVFISRLDEQQQRWYVALESKKLGHGGDKRLSEITGMDVETIRRGRRELDGALADRPTDRVRLPGGGRHRVEKNNPAW
jgi:hypothetical protein